jgi:hypothetical protein
MVEVVEALNGIREELRELRSLHQGLLERLIAMEDPREEERKAIEEGDEVATEGELLKALGG